MRVFPRPLTILRALLRPVAMMAASWSALSAAVPANDAPLTTAAQVRSLSEEEAKRGLAVHLRGVFMGDADPEGIAFVVQDETEGIYVQGPAELVTGLTRGDLLEIEGITDPGGFAPYVAARNLRKIGRAPIPEPLKVTLDELNAGQLDAKWVEITGTIRWAEPTAPSDSAPPPPGTRYAAPNTAGARAKEPKVKMKLASGSLRVVVEINGDLKPEDYVDAEVRVRGLCFNLHNQKRQFVRPFVQVPRGVDITIVRPPPAEPFSGVASPVTSLLQFEQLTGEHGHRVHVRGTVIYHRPGAVLWLRDQKHSLRVETTQGGTLAAGDEVDVVGFPARGQYSAVLEDAAFRKLPTRGELLPHLPTDLSSALQNDADFVQLEARLADVRRLPDSVVLTLDWHDTTVRAQLQVPDNQLPPADWLPGSVIRVSGVCAVNTDEAGPLGGLWEPRSFQLLLRSPADVAVVVPPPWWNAQRVVWVLSGSLALAVGAVAVVMLASRRRLQDQEHRRAMAETEFTAILSERNRVAREIHDTLSQSLGAISVQLELARMHAHELSTPVRNHLGSAHKLARAALAEARDSIWNMRSQVLEKSDLAAALKGILVRMTEGTGIAPHFRLEGESRRLPPVVENNLLRIGQEAITNATRHARPKRIEVTLTFDGRAIRLVVADDGVGFSLGAQPESDRRSFGLVGINERAALLGGTAEVQSAPGQGTRVLVNVSV